MLWRISLTLLALALLILAAVIMRGLAREGESPSHPAGVSMQALGDTPESHLFTRQASIQATTLADTAVSGEQPAPHITAQEVAEEYEAIDGYYDVEVLLEPLISNGFVWNERSRAAVMVFVERMPAALSDWELQAYGGAIQRAIGGGEGEYLAEVIMLLYGLHEDEAREFGEDVPGSMAAMREDAHLRERFRKAYLGDPLYQDIYGQPADSEHIAKTQEGIKGGLHDAIRALEKDGASNADIYTHLMESEGPEAAESYMGMQRNADWWHQRYERFMHEKRVIDQAGLAQADKDRQVEALLARHYSANELHAAKAYLAMQESSAELE